MSKKSEGTNKKTSVKKTKSSTKKANNNIITYGSGGSFQEQLLGNPDSVTEQQEIINNIPERRFIAFFSPETDVIILNISDFFGQTLKDLVSLGNSYAAGNIQLTIIDNESNLLLNGNNILVNSQYLYNTPSNTFIINPRNCFKLNEYGTEGETTIDMTDILFTIKMNDFSWLHAYENDIYNFTIRISWGSRDDIIVIDAYASMFNKNKFDIYKKCGHPMIKNQMSYMLLRTNPKLTGNIKLVVDNNYNLYLDTFKVSSNLAGNKFRKVKISIEGNYPRDIRQAFKDLPKGDIFKYPDNVTDPHKIYTDLNDQFETVYNYGAETNTDFLYPENFRILAPLWINNELPDLFVIFKIEDYYNTESYINKIFNDTEKFQNFLKEADIVKVFDLRTNTTIGQYLNNYKNKYFSNNSVFLQFIQYNKSPEENIYTTPLGKNSWYGISLDTGVITHKEESCYFGNKLINSEIQEDFDAYLINGYERNNMVSQNLINLEFLFNDPYAENYSMHRYFGLYLKKNELIKFASIEKFEENGKITLLKYDTDYNIIDDTIYNNIFNQYPDRIFLGESGDVIKRLKNEYDKNIFISKDAANKPGSPITSSNASYIGSTENLEFMTFKMKKPMDYGEHLKIVVPLDSLWYDQYIFEIIASNDKRLIDTENNISPYILYNQQDILDIDTSIYLKTRLRTVQSEFDDYTNPSPAYKGKKIQGYTGSSKNYDINNYPLNHYAQFDVIPSGPASWDYEVQQENLLYNGPNTVTDDSNLDSPEYANPLQFNFNIIQKYPKIFRLAFYSQDLDNPELPASISEQIKRIAACIKKFDWKFYTGFISDDSFSIISTTPDTYIEHITSDILNIEWDKELLLEVENYPVSNEFKEKAVNVYQNKKEVNPTFEFLNDIKLDVNVYPISWNTVSYTQNLVGFAPINFELLGWRKASVIKFIKLPKFAYEIELDEKSLQYFNMHVMAKGLNNSFYNLSKFNIDENIIISITDSIETSNSTFSEKVESSLLYLNSPYNPSRWIIASNTALSILNGHINLYTPQECDYSLAGILPIKDFDYSLSDYSRTIKENLSLEITKGEKLFINEYYEKSITTNVLYKLEKGCFDYIDIPVNSNFIIYKENDNFIIYYKNKSIKLNNNYITCSEDTIIVQNNDLYNKDKIISIPKYNLYNYFKNKNLSNDLNYPIVFPSIFKWESTGIYNDLNSLLDIKYITNYNNKNISFIKTNKSFGSETNIINFLQDNINIVSPESSEVDTWKKIIENKKIDYSLLRFLSNSQGNDIFFAQSIYNQYTNSLYFIFNGLKISIKLENYLINKNINLSDYANYNVLLLFDYIDNYSLNDFYISEPEKIILFIIHSLDLNIFNDKISDKILTPKPTNFYNKNLDENILENNSNYNWIKSEYNIIPNTIYGAAPVSTNSDGILSCILTQAPSSKYTYALYDEIVWFDYITYNNITYTELQGFNYVIPSKNFYMATLHPKENIISLLNSGIWNFDSRIFQNLSPATNPTYGILMPKNYTEYLNYESYLFKYSINYNKIKEDSNIETLKKYILNTNINLYIIKENSSIVDLLNCKIGEHLNIMIESPSLESQLKYNQGFFIPRFIDIIEFKSEEDKSLVHTLNQSFLYSNTNVKTVNTLTDIYCNKVFSTNIKNPILINYENNPVHILNSNWDKNYYRIWDDENSWGYVNGYIPGIEDKSYFGSKCLVLNDPVIILRNWNNLITISEADTEFSNTDKTKLNEAYETDKVSNVQRNRKTLHIDINITQALYQYFKNEEPTLYNNWVNFTDNKKDYSFNNYIKNTLIKYFKIDDENNLQLYSKINKLNQSIPTVLISQPDDFEHYTVEKNFKTKYKNINNNIILSIDVPLTENKSYYFTLNIKSV